MIINSHPYISQYRYLDIWSKILTLVTARSVIIVIQCYNGNDSENAEPTL